ncbi:tRNA wybutosine-synthesizing protein 3 [Merluccius polli]|uniref:tRNA wybutosine-synthesizing protein 3 homolog n=1 Tax=Merluccius polli TaxID=89951 RepID=A0AA47P6M3_MERPO|nr:tRNA wybutosine-synthesizing protein 3 [Merluccius polli]
MATAFSQWKKQSQNKVDVSKKGRVDADVSRVVALLNGCEDFFTTSSCSGRLLLTEGDPDCRAVQKLHCVWLFVSHQRCTAEDLVSSLADSTGDAVLKFEPFVLHVQCRRLEDAQLVHAAAVNSGLRNSGLTVGKAGKIIVAVRSTHGLEVPLSHQGRLLVSQDYIHFLVQIANQKMEENLRRIDRFYLNLQSALSADPPQELQPPQSPTTCGLQIQETERQEEEKERKEEEEEEKEEVYLRRRRRRRGARDGGDCHGDSEVRQPDLDDCLDLFI